MSGREGRADVLRRDRAMDDDWIRAFLERASFGFLATVADGGQPFINSNLFVYDPDRHCIYVHTARRGRTRSNLDQPAKVAFAVGGMGRLLPADEALEFSVEYAGVTAFGAGQVVDDAAEKEAALQLLLDKYAPHLRPGRDYRPITEGELRRTAVYRIDVDAWSGKQKAAAADFAGAYLRDDVQVPFEPPASG